ncbi:predicted protein [Verticillium alfalfae VaMs.102]|uniref:Predicted protein n=1 Tax=Verticillium alfalfae (strain VaMs.102 / ATCC MYA-4576 / FGSC 10136) TaxID=526221 RepID=C9SE41_VERA1|nr:predicted protein [Verticillium alfalfae VaMs.102]EEY17288.1 predicted protein [Verticillium alfalfae VaMs.102]
MASASPTPLTNPVETLASELKQLRIKSPERPVSRRRHGRSSFETDSSWEPLKAIKETCEPDDADTNGNALYFQDLLEAQVFRAVGPDGINAAGPKQDLLHDYAFLASIARHCNGRFDYVLSVPESAIGDGRGTCSPPNDRTIRYGCNLLIERKETSARTLCEGHTNIVYTVLSTELLGQEDLHHQLRHSYEGGKMNFTEPIVRVTSPPAADNLAGEVVDIFIPKRSEPASETLAEKLAGIVLPDDCYANYKQVRKCSGSTEGTSSSVLTPTRSASLASSYGRIEDSVEALDKLEDELEELDAATRVDHFVSPKKNKRRSLMTMGEAPRIDRVELKRSSSVTHGPAGRSATVRVKPTGLRPTLPTLRRSASLTGLARDESKDVAAVCEGGVSAPATCRKPVAARPPSLNPPKAAVKSAKAPTKASFELPGEAVARRIKEQREARRAAAATAALASPDKTTTTTTPMPQRSRSIKAPTRPNFELPGEAISRRKREQREKELREQEEAEKKRREFRAQPVRVNPAASTFPRATAASRARRVKAGAGVEENAPLARSTSVTTASTALKRMSMVSGGTVGVRRARHSAGSGTSSGTSSGMSSGMSSRRSAVSVEEVQRQRLRGKVIYEQDNCYVEERERERREREASAKRAREEAAERSRQASRAWAEKQKRRLTASFQG